MTQLTVKEMLELAQQEGVLSQQGFSSMAAIINNADAAARINNNLGKPISGKPAKLTTLLYLLIDDSSSIGGNVSALADAANLIMDSIQESKAGDALVFVQYLNGTVLNSYVPVEQATRLVAGQNYFANGGTPLYDKIAEGTASVVAKAMEYVQKLVTVNVIFVVITDGHDEHSRMYRNPADLQPVINDVVNSEVPGFVYMGWGIGSYNFMDTFTSIGFLPQWVQTTGATAHEIRVGAKAPSRSAARLSQSANFSQTAQASGGLSGFMGNPNP